jgi:ABC-2 type transport system ATP-binding protein
MGVLLRAEKLTKHYGTVVALNSATFDVTDGVTGLLGSNGAGKSTAKKLFLGLIKPTSGSMQVLGIETAHNADVRARLGYMPEHDCLPNNVAATKRDEKCLLPVPFNFVLISSLPGRLA